MLAWIDDHHCVLDGTTFQLKDVEDTGDRDASSELVLLKPRWMLERYIELGKRLRSPTVVELGIHRGGSTVFLSRLLRPRKLVAVDIRPAAAPELVEFAARSGLGDAVRTFYGVDQSDRPRLEAILAAELGREELDLVIDDASHLLGPSTVSFNHLFPRLRPGGWFVLEDWSADHAFESAIARRPDLLAKLAASPDLRAPDPPMSRLVLEIVLGAASSPDVFSCVEVAQGWVAVQRGGAALDRSRFAVSSTYGALGRDLLRQP